MSLEPALARAILRAADQRAQTVFDGRLIQIRYGTVASLDLPNRIASVNLAGMPTPSPGFAFGLNAPAVTDRVRVVILPTGDRYIDEVFGVPFALAGAAGATTVLSGRRSADASPRWTISADGAISIFAAPGDAHPVLRLNANGTVDWGAGGATATDSVLRRIAADVLGTDDAFRLGLDSAITEKTAEGTAVWDDTLRSLLVGDSVRAKAVSPVGWTPVAGHPSINNATVFGTTTLDVVAGGNGGARAFPIWVPAPMLVHDFVVWNNNTASLRTAEMRLYLDRLNNAAAIDFVAGSDALFSFTPSAAGAWPAVPSGAPFLLAPGLYWGVIRNTSTAQTFALGAVAAGSTSIVTQALANAAVPALGTPITITAWTPIASVIGVVLRGRVAGMSTSLLD